MEKKSKDLGSGDVDPELLKVRSRSGSTTIKFRIYDNVRDNLLR
jgi:hypothetical protein